MSRDDDTQLSTSLISDRLLITNNVYLHSTTLTLHNLLTCLITFPDAPREAVEQQTAAPPGVKQQ